MIRDELQKLADMSIQKHLQKNARFRNAHANYGALPMLGDAGGKLKRAMILVEESRHSVVAMRKVHPELIEQLIDIVGHCWQAMEIWMRYTGLWESFDTHPVFPPSGYEEVIALPIVKRELEILNEEIQKEKEGQEEDRSRETNDKEDKV